MGDESFKETLTNFIFKSLENDRPAWCDFLEKSNHFDLTPDDLQHVEDEDHTGVKHAVRSFHQADQSEELLRVVDSRRKSESEREPAVRKRIEEQLEEIILNFAEDVADLIGSKRADLNLHFDETKLNEIKHDIVRLIFKIPTSRDTEPQQNVHKTKSPSVNSCPMPSTSNSYTVGSSISQNCIGKSCPPGAEKHHDTVKHAAKLIKSEHYYAMTRKPRGYCIIVNCGIHIGDRSASDKHVKFLRSIFEQLFFEVKEYRNQTADEIVRNLETVARCAELINHDAFILIIMSPANVFGTVGADGSVCPFDFLINPFNNENCPNLVGKPKMFFVQACLEGSHDFGVAVKDVPNKSRSCSSQNVITTRSRSSPNGVTTRSRSARNVVTDRSQSAKNVDTTRSRSAKNVDTTRTRSAENVVTTTSCNAPDVVTTRRTFPLSDIYVCWSSPIGHVAMRNEETGFWFGNYLGEVIRDHACEFHLEKIIKEVTKRVNSQMSVTGTMQSVFPTLIGWTKELYFNPGLYE